jgi:hypothetical protein
VALTHDSVTKEVIDFLATSFVGRAAKRSPDAKTLSLLSADRLAAPHIGSVSDGFSVELELRNLVRS